MLFALGFLSLMLGFAMLVLGEMPLSKTRRVPAGASRIAGAILVAYFPLVLGVRYFWVTFDLDRHVAGNVVFAILWVLLAMASGWIALRAAFPKKERRAAASAFPGVAERDPFAADLAVSEETMIAEPPTAEDAGFSFEPVVQKPKKPVAAPKQPSGPSGASKAPSTKPSKKAAGGDPFDFS